MKLALAAAERAAPGVSAHVLATQTVVGADVESHAGSHLWRSLTGASSRRIRH